MASNAAVPFWRAAGMTYITYSNICANLVRNCLKEPYKTEALSREKVHFSISKWTDGKPEKPTIRSDSPEEWVVWLVIKVANWEGLEEFNFCYFCNSCTMPVNRFQGLRCCCIFIIISTLQIIDWGFIGLLSQMFLSGFLVKVKKKRFSLRLCDCAYDFFVCDLGSVYLHVKSVFVLRL